MLTAPQNYTVFGGKSKVQPKAIKQDHKTLTYQTIHPADVIHLLRHHKDIIWRVMHLAQSLCLITQSFPTLWDPRDCDPPGSSVLGDSPGKNTGVGCHALLQGIVPAQVSCIAGDSLLSEPQGKPKNTRVGSLFHLQGIFLTQELNWGLLHYRRILYQLSYQGRPG